MASLDRVLNFLRSDPSAEEIAEFLIFSDITRPNPLACAIYLPDEDGVFSLAGQYGFEKWSVDRINDKWDILTSQLRGIRYLKTGSPIHMDIEVLMAEAERLGYKTGHRTGVESAWLIPLMGRVRPVGVLIFYMPSTVDAKLQPDSFTIKIEALGAAIATLIQGENIRGHKTLESTASLSLWTDRQERILAGVSRGQSNGEIAQEIDVSESTVKFEVRKLLKELGVKNRKEAVKKAMEISSGLGKIS